MGAEYDPTEIPGLRRKDSMPRSAAVGGGDDDEETSEATKRPSVSFSSDTAHLRCRGRSTSTPGPCDPHAARPQISRLDAERAGRLYLQSHAERMSSRRTDRQSRSSSSRATARCQNAVPQSLRDARPDLMKAVLDDTGNGAKLRESLAAMKRAHTIKVMNEFVDNTQAEITLFHSRCKGRCMHGRCALSASMGVLVLSVGLMLTILVFQQPVVNYFLYSGMHVWEADNMFMINDTYTAEQMYQQHFELNEPMGGFISVTGLVFALVFASNYTDAQCRLNEIRNSLAVEAGGVHTAMLLVRTLDEDDPSGAFKSRVLLLLASYIEHLAEEITWAQTGQGEEPPPSNVEILYATIPFLSEIGSDGDGDDMDRVLVQRTVDALNASSEARQIRVSQEKRNISPYVYCFLWQMAFVTYLGVIFLQAGSQMMNTCVALLTITSVTTSMLILADLEKPYDGLVRVETDIFNTIRRDISVVLHDAEGAVGELQEPALGASGSDEADHPQEDSRPARIRSMSMRTKIDSDYHMREAVSQMGRLRRHSVDSPDTGSASKLHGSDSHLSVKSEAKSETKNPEHTKKSGVAAKYQTAQLPNTIGV